MVLGSTNSNGRDKEMAEQPVQTRSHSDTEERHQEKGLPIATSPCPSEQMDSTDTADGTPEESTSPKPFGVPSGCHTFDPGTGRTRRQHYQPSQKRREDRSLQKRGRST